MRLQIDVTISDYERGGNFRLCDTVEIPKADFMVMAGILAKFHDLLAEVKAAKEISREA